MEFRTYFVYFHAFSYKFKVQRTPTEFGLPVFQQHLFRAFFFSQMTSHAVHYDVSIIPSHQFSIFEDVGGLTALPYTRRICESFVGDLVRIHAANMMPNVAEIALYSLLVYLDWLCHWEPGFNCMLPHRNKIEMRSLIIAVLLLPELCWNTSLLRPLARAKPARISCFDANVIWKSLPIDELRYLEYSRWYGVVTSKKRV